MKPDKQGLIRAIEELAEEMANKHDIDEKISRLATYDAVIDLINSDFEFAGTLDFTEYYYDLVELHQKKNYKNVRRN